LILIRTDKKHENIITLRSKGELSDL